jgi:hypothetical protein
VQPGVAWYGSPSNAKIDNHSIDTDPDIYGSKRAGKQGDLPKDPKYYIHTSDIVDIVSYKISSSNADRPN